jgi:hypothetical protein
MLPAGLARFFFSHSPLERLKDIDPPLHLFNTEVELTADLEQPVVGPEAHINGALQAWGEKFE